MEKPIILFIGGKLLTYYQLELIETSNGKFEVLHLTYKDAIERISKENTSDRVVAIITPLFHSQLEGIPRKDADGGWLAGCVVIETLRPLCKDAMFFLFNGTHQGRVLEDSKVVFLPEMEKCQPKDLAAEMIPRLLI